MAKKKTASERIAICRACPTGDNKTLFDYKIGIIILPEVTQCKLCGCTMELKTKLPWKKCDANHW